MPVVQETTALSVYQPYPSPSSAPLNYGFENLFSSDASVHVQLEHLNPYQPQDINFPSLVTSHNQCSLSAPLVPVLTAQSSHSFFTCSRGFQPLSSILPPSRSPPSAAVSNNNYNEQPRKRRLRYPCTCPNCKNGVNSQVLSREKPTQLPLSGMQECLREDITSETTSTDTHKALSAQNMGAKSNSRGATILTRHMKTHQKKSSGDPNSPNAKNKDPSPSSASEIPFNETLVSTYFSRMCSSDFLFIYTTNWVIWL